MVATPAVGSRVSEDHECFGDTAMGQTSEGHAGPVSTCANGRGLIAWGLVALVGILSPGIANQPTVTDLLGTLGLSGYPFGTKPPEFHGPHNGGGDGDAR
jgi:hypothetical protein